MDAETKQAKNKLFIDTNEDSVAVMLVNYDRGVATLLSIGYEVSKIRARNRLLAKYCARERSRVKSRLKKVAHAFGKIVEELNASLVRERLRDLKSNKKSRSRRLNYRPDTFPYRKFFTYLDTEFAERGLAVEEVDANGTSITCPVCSTETRRTE